MFRNIPRPGRALLAALCVVLLASAAFASAAFGNPLLKIDLDGSITRGSESLPLTSSARPGDLLNWSMKVTNRGDAATPATWSVDGEIDPNTVYVVGSATGDASPAVTFSIDGGRTFSARPMVTYTEGGVEMRRPAPVEAYRLVRFTWSSAINPGEGRAVYYKARVR